MARNGTHNCYREHLVAVGVVVVASMPVVALGRSTAEAAVAADIAAGDIEPGVVAAAAAALGLPYTNNHKIKRVLEIY